MTGSSLRRWVPGTGDGQPVDIAEGDIIRTDLMKIARDRSPASAFDRTRTTRTIVQSDLWRVIWAVRRP
jgi:hypothetical protein